MPPDERACAYWRDAVPGYIETHLRGGDAPGRYPSLYRHLAACEECSELVGETICALLRPEIAAPTAHPAEACCLTGVSCRV